MTYKISTNVYKIYLNWNTIEKNEYDNTEYDKVK